MSWLRITPKSEACALSEADNFDRNVHRKPRPAMGGIGGARGHNMKRNYLTGKPFGMLRAVSSVERPRPVAGELHCVSKTDPFR